MNTKNKEIWEQAWAAEQPLLKQYAQIERLIYCRDIIGNVANKNLIYGENGYVRSYFTKNSYRQIQQDGKKLLNKEKSIETIKFVKKTIKQFWGIAKDLRIASQKEKDVHGKTLIDLIKAFDKICLKIFACFLTTWEATSYYPEQRLKKLLKLEFFDTWENKFMTLLAPSDPNLLLKERESWAVVLKNPSKKNIKEHMLTYAFLFSNIDSEDDAFAIMWNRVKKESFEYVQKEVIKSQKQLRKNKKKQNEIFALCRYSEEIKNLTYLLQKFTLLRLELKAAWSSVHYYLYQLYSRIASETLINIRDIMMFWTMKEVVSFVENAVHPSKIETRQRRNFYLLLFQYRKIELFTGEKAKKIKNKILCLCQDSIKDIKEFKGAVANRGKVHGIVLLVKFDDLRLIEKAVKSIKKNNIIFVSGMTNLNMVPLIKKAKAIITDEGGVTCHASIISRELKIPCIIGTKIATQVLKDGDLVEVDADKGIVKIIKRAEQQG